MARLLPLVLALAGLVAGTGLGLVLRPATEPQADGVGAEGGAGGGAGGGAEAAAAPPAAADAGEFVRLNSQFVVPVVSGGRVASLVLLSLSIEVPPGMASAVYAVEPKLRDAFLQVLFDHANAGGFDGSFTAAENTARLRTALREAARSVLGPAARNVLIVELLRKDS